MGLQIVSYVVTKKSVLMLIWYAWRNNKFFSAFFHLFLLKNIKRFQIR